MEFDLEEHVKVDVRRGWLRPHVEQALSDLSTIPEGQLLLSSASEGHPPIIITDNPDFTFSDGSSLAEEDRDLMQPYGSSFMMSYENESGQEELILYISDMRSFTSEGASVTRIMVHELFHAADPAFYEYDDNWSRAEKLSYFHAFEARAMEYTNAFMAKYFNAEPRLSYATPPSELDKSPPISCSTNFTPFEFASVPDGETVAPLPRVSAELPAAVCGFAN